MSQFVFIEGQRIGTAEAKKCRGSILGCVTSEELGRLSGKKMLELVSKNDAASDHPYCNADSWRLGFFSGFMDQADKIKERRT